VNGNIRAVGRPRGLTKRKAAQVECERGHPFDKSNTRVSIDREGYVHRRCRTCDRIRAARYRKTSPSL
jgi:hypothetical protein